MFRFIQLAQFTKKRMKLLFDKFLQKLASHSVWKKPCLGGQDEEPTVMITHRMTS